jgi:hypothetical protein
LRGSAALRTSATRVLPHSTTRLDLGSDRSTIARDAIDPPRKSTTASSLK